MRKALVSLSVITAVGSTLVAGGAFSVFNDTGTASGGYVTGTVKLSLGDNVFHLTGDCATNYVDDTSTDPSHNMGSVNNTACTSVIPVTNAGSLPMTIDSSSSVLDVITNADGTPAADAAGLPCFSSVLRAADLTGALNPGQTRDVHVTTTTNTDNACQAKTDVVTATINVNESLPATTATP